MQLLLLSCQVNFCPENFLYFLRLLYIFKCTSDYFWSWKPTLWTLVPGSKCLQYISRLSKQMRDLSSVWFVARNRVITTIDFNNKLFRDIMWSLTVIIWCSVRFVDKNRVITMIQINNKLYRDIMWSLTVIIWCSVQFVDKNRVIAVIQINNKLYRDSMCSLINREY